MRDNLYTRATKTIGQRKGLKKGLNTPRNEAQVEHMRANTKVGTAGTDRKQNQQIVLNKDYKIKQEAQKIKNKDPDINR